MAKMKIKSVFDQLLTTKEAAILLKLYPGTLDNYRSTGRGPNYVKVGGSVRYKLSALMDYIDAQEVKVGEVKNDIQV